MLLDHVACMHDAFIYDACMYVVNTYDACIPPHKIKSQKHPTFDRVSP